MTKLGLFRTFATAGAVSLVAASVSLACTTKSATLIGRMSVASAPAGSQCVASGETCTMFEVMSATNADGLALGDLTGKTFKAKMAPGVAMPASNPADAIWVAKADIDWDHGYVMVASVEPASEPVAMAAKASWEKCMTATALASAAPAGGKSGCCAAGAKANAATASAAVAGSNSGCGTKADAATANSKGSCGAKADAATAGGSSCHSKSAKSDAAAAAARAIVFNVSGMTCENCVAKVEKALMGVKGVASAKVDLENKNATVNTEEGVKAEDLVKAIKAAGFDAQLAAAEKETEARG